jgi:TRAP-type C4-dicarboxylate transport system substrate-binding protein
MKLRVPPSPLWTSMFKALDAAPTSINFAEVYSALQTKIVEGQKTPGHHLHGQALRSAEVLLHHQPHGMAGSWATRSPSSACPRTCRT